MGGKLPSSGQNETPRVNGEGPVPILRIGVPVPAVVPGLPREEGLVLALPIEEDMS